MSHVVWYQDGSFSLKTPGRDYLFYVHHWQHGRTFWSSYDLKDEKLLIWITNDFGELVRYGR